MNGMAERLLLIGEAGTGKELVAKMIHFNSKRKFWPFLTYRCNNAEENEDELFGSESSPENPVTKQSLFCKAHKGTLYLGEIGALSLEGQKKLVRFIHENYYLPPKTILKEPLNIRLIFSSSVELKPLVEEGKLLQELYDLLNTLTVHLPPLRERKEEIPRLARHFLKQFSRELNRKMPRLTREAKDRLCGYEWPGNISELKRIMQLLINLFDRPVIDKAMVEGAFLYDRIQEKIKEKRPLNEVSEAIKKFYEVVNPTKLRIPVL
jgi:DNA-binding NtrC family response regulator